MNEVRIVNSIVSNRKLKSAFDDREGVAGSKGVGERGKEGLQQCRCSPRRIAAGSQRSPLEEVKLVLAGCRAVSLAFSALQLAN